MLPPVVNFGIFDIPTSAIFAFAAIFLALFLFWRTGRHELIDADFLFDVILIAALGGLIVGRIFEFAVYYERFAWSVKKLIFFNVWGGIDSYGALVGALGSVALYLRGKKISFWQVLDLAAAPIVFAQSLIAFGQLIQVTDKLSIAAFFGYFLTFWVLKRLETQKRHVGSFGSFYLTAMGLLTLLFLVMGNQQVVKIGQVLPYTLLTGVSLLCFGSISWYILAERNPKGDIRGISALLLLALFKSKRVLTNVREADELAKHIIALPYFAIKIIYSSLFLILREIIEGMRSLIHAFGFKKFR